VRDSIARPDDLFKAAANDGQSALAITDHGNLSGLYVAHNAAKKVGVNFIAGLEAYMAIEDGESDARLRRGAVPRPIFDDSSTYLEDGKGESKYTHLTLLAESSEGLSNLMRLSALSNDGDAFWSRPRMDLSLLVEHSKGLIALSGCLGGAIKRCLAVGDVEGAHNATASMVEIFGVDGFFIEVMSHGIAQEDKLNSELLLIAKKFGLRVVATNDSHFTSASDAHAHEAWLCGASNQTLSDPNHWRFTGEGYYLRTAVDMRAIFDDEPGFEDATDNTLLIAERATSYEMFPKHRLRIPIFDPHNQRSSDELLYEKVKDGARRRYATPLPDDVKERLRHELDIISNAGLADYFLIVADMIDQARSRGIRVGPGRGSAAGSCVSYCMGIIAVDPLAHGLLFERFLNPTRNKMPDIDTDFEQGRRQEVVNYLIERWGKDSVALIGTLGYSLSKNSLRVAGRVLDKAPLGALLADQVPTMGDGKTSTLALLQSPQFGPGSGFREAVGGADATEIVGYAARFEGVVNTESIHPCGVVIGDELLVGQIPLRSDRRPTDKGGTGGWVSEFDGNALEDLGYLKMDVLGLLTLDVVEATVREIERRHGVLIDVDAILDDGGEQAKKAWALVSSGRTTGLFQVEGTGMQELARRLRPASVDEAAVLIALYRPGPLGIGMHDMYANRKAGIEKVNYDIFTRDAGEVEVIKSVLDETLGVLVYQEQLFRIAELVAGFNPPERDNLLRAVGKKIREAMDRSGEFFIAGAQADLDMAGNPKLAFSQRTAENLWEAMKSSGEYSFNKSHSVGYARLSYITAWLKANYPAEFAAGWLARADNQEKRMAFLSALAEEGITLRHPNVNVSVTDPTVDADGAVLLGLGKIRDVGSVGSDIVEERERNGPYRSLVDLSTRVKVSEGTRRISITALRALIESGACDEFGPRKGMFEAIEALRKNSNALVSNAEWGVLEKTVRERQRLGVLVSENPLVAFSPQIKTWRSPQAPRERPVPLHNLPSSGATQTIGVVIGFEIAKRKTRFAKMTLAGTRSTIECVLWSATLERIERAGLLPAIGDIVGVDAIVKEKTPYHHEVESDEEIDVVAVKELIISALWSQPLEDLSVDNGAEGFTSQSDQGSLWDQPVGDSTAVTEPSVIKSVRARPDEESVDEFDQYVDISEFDGDDGFDHPLTKKAGQREESQPTPEPVRSEAKPRASARTSTPPEVVSSVPSGHRRFRAWGQKTD
jgi:DNA polymerase-3 subunit alpha